MSPRALEGLALLDEVGALSVVLPELVALRGVEQTVYHHRDAFGHTLEVLEHAIALEADPAAVLGDAELGARVAALLAEPLGDELPRAGGLRFAALLHDIGKPATQMPNPKGGFGFPGHDRVGDDMARGVLTRLRASERLRAFVAALTRHHLRPGFLVHARPLSRRSVYGYLRGDRAGGGGHAAPVGGRPAGDARAQGRRGDRQAPGAGARAARAGAGLARLGGGARARAGRRAGARARHHAGAGAGAAARRAGRGAVRGGDQLARGGAELRCRSAAQPPR